MGQASLRAACAALVTGFGAGGNCSCSFHLPGQSDKFSLTKERFGKADFLNN